MPWNKTSSALPKLIEESTYDLEFVTDESWDGWEITGMRENRDNGRRRMQRLSARRCPATMSCLCSGPEDN